EIIVVDDGSAEDLTPLLTKYPRVKVHRFEESVGPAAARNQGAAMASCPILFLFDADVVCPPQLFETAAKILEANPGAAAISFINQPYDPNSCCVENYTAVFEDFYIASVFTDHPDPAPAEGMMTRCGAVRHSVFDSLGGFD